MPRTDAARIWEAMLAIYPAVITHHNGRGKRSPEYIAHLVAEHAKAAVGEWHASTTQRQGDPGSSE